MNYQSLTSNRPSKDASLEEWQEYAVLLEARVLLLENLINDLETDTNLPSTEQEVGYE